MSIVLLAALALQAASATPSAEAEQLGRRLAAASGLATMIPLLVEKDLAELAAEQPDLTASERTRLLAIGQAEASRNVERLIAEMGRGYAKRLSVADLKVLVAQSELPATAKLRAAEPAVIIEVMSVIGEIDLKKATAVAFCKETAKLCSRE